MATMAKKRILEKEKEYKELQLRLKDLTYEDRLRELNLFSLDQRRERGT